MCRAQLHLSDAYFYESQPPIFQVQMHVRGRVPLFKTMPLDAVLRNPNSTVPGAPRSSPASSHRIHSRRPASDNETHRRNPDTTPGLGINSSLSYSGVKRASSQGDRSRDVLVVRRVRHFASHLDHARHGEFRKRPRDRSERDGRRRHRSTLQSDHLARHCGRVRCRDVGNAKDFQAHFHLDVLPALLDRLFTQPGSIVIRKLPVVLNRLLHTVQPGTTTPSPPWATEGELIFGLELSRRKKKNAEEVSASAIINS